VFKTGVEQTASRWERERDLRKKKKGSIRSKKKDYEKKRSGLRGRDKMEELGQLQ